MLNKNDFKLDRIHKLQSLSCKYFGSLQCYACLCDSMLAFCWCDAIQILYHCSNVCLVYKCANAKNGGHYRSTNFMDPNTGKKCHQQHLQFVPKGRPRSFASTPRPLRKETWPPLLQYSLFFIPSNSKAW